MKKILMILLFLYSTLPACGFALAVDDNAPDFQGVTLDGKEISYLNIKGKKPVYLIFWATWCPICKSEIPVLKKLYKQLGNKIEFIGINVGINEKLEVVKEYVKKNALNFPIIFDRDKKIIKAFGVMGTPTHIVIDRKGVIKYWNAEPPMDLDKHLKELN